MKASTLSAVTLTLALVSALSLVTSAQATVPPVAAAKAPMSALFVGQSARLTPAGERWLQAQVALHAQRKTPTLIVAMPGPPDSRLQKQRVHTLRQRLAALGVSPGQVFFEAGRAA